MPLASVPRSARMLAFAAMMVSVKKDVRMHAHATFGGQVQDKAGTGASAMSAKQKRGTGASAMSAKQKRGTEAMYSAAVLVLLILALSASALILQSVVHAPPPHTRVEQPPPPTPSTVHGLTSAQVCAQCVPV